jgi:predicted nucleic acid-binding protein
MTTRLLDTNIVSYMDKRHPLLARYHPHIDGFELAISFQTRSELEAGGLLANWGSKRWAQLKRTLSTITVIHSDEDICRRWAEVQNFRKSRPIGDADCWIAATALSHGLELVTHNPADFGGIPGLIVITEAP